MSRLFSRTMNEIQIHYVILILDWGFVSDDIANEIILRDCSFILPQCRNSNYFKTRVYLNDTFRYHTRLIHCGKRVVEDKFLYLFEDEDLKLEERKTLFDKIEKGSITKDEAKTWEKLAGRILFLSNVNKTSLEIYELCHENRYDAERPQAYRMKLPRRFHIKF